jgi:hypothetical protein
MMLIALSPSRTHEWEANAQKGNRMPSRADGIEKRGNEIEHSGHYRNEYDMADSRRLTINPPLTEAEFARFCTAYPGLKINRDPNGVIVMIPRRKCREDYVDWLLSKRGTIDSDSALGDDKPTTGAKIDRASQDAENLQALKGLRNRLIRLRETSEGAHAATLNVAIRALDSAIDILESVIAYEQGMPQKVASRDMDTYEQRRESISEIVDSGCLLKRNESTDHDALLDRLQRQPAINAGRWTREELYARQSKSGKKSKARKRSSSRDEA